MMASSLLVFGLFSLAHNIGNKIRLHCILKAFYFSLCIVGSGGNIILRRAETHDLESIAPVRVRVSVVLPTSSIFVRGIDMPARVYIGTDLFILSKYTSITG